MQPGSECKDRSRVPPIAGKVAHFGKLETGRVGSVRSVPVNTGWLPGSGDSGSTPLRLVLTSLFEPVPTAENCPGI